MRKTILLNLGLLIFLSFMLQGAKCPGIPETEKIEITVVTEQFVELKFLARGDINVHSDIQYIDVDQLRQDIDDLGIEIDKVDTLRVSAVEYGTVAYYEPAQDRAITNGNVTVIRTDTQAQALLVSNFNMSVYPLLGQLAPAPIVAGGIDFINDLLADLLTALQNGTNPTLGVEGIVTGSSEPSGRESNFDWRMRIYFQIPGGFPVDVVDI
ncbi:MAG: hypothetical protein KJ970_02975 [Candidatus Eisenbacteria bacterium]|uniref:Uncharacterized protein n=1 Tax=Eiseniibacteriota bacterium TaxID=2212470 RepID=A0A948RUD4_UNCEI|nr:hypothetical protein [Candidatus Eisenbacteria bacterium]MBU1948280.1 hypothetical protein [Candidatus Eisenbacteria bacterium]MBU2689864.1 hypothetical protein [Candidatus Eisenbacteria bacterium]